MTTSPIRVTLRHVLTVLVSLGLAAALAACGGASASSPEPSPEASPSAYTQVSEASLTPGDPVPAPTGPVVLTVVGGSTTNVDDELQLDMDLIERMGVVRYRTFDRQAEGRTVSFSGPLLRSVLSVAGVPASATLNAVALNDYAVELPASDAVDFPVMLATKADGDRMTVERYGPTRVVYPTRGFDLEPTTYDPRWIWQLARIEVR